MTLGEQVVLRSNTSSDALRFFGEDLINFARALAQLGDDKSGFPQPVDNSNSPANPGQQLGASGRSRLLVFSSSQD